MSSRYNKRSTASVVTFTLLAASTALALPADIHGRADVQVSTASPQCSTTANVKAGLVDCATDSDCVAAYGSSSPYITGLTEAKCTNSKCAITCHAGWNKDEAGANCIAPAGGFSNVCCGGSVATNGGCFCPADSWKTVKYLSDDKTQCKIMCPVS